MKNLLTPLCTALVLLSACSKENVSPNPTPKTSISADSQVLGPYTPSATLTQILKNYKITLVDQPGLATGVYFCDVYKSEVKITLAPGQLFLVNPTGGVSKLGFQDFTTQKTGIVQVSESAPNGGATYTLTTYSVIAKSNVIGQAVSGGPYPQNLIGNTYTYQIYVP